MAEHAAHADAAKKVVSNPVDYETETFLKGLQYERPPFTFDSTKWAAEAKSKLALGAWNYVNGSAGTGGSDDNNVAAFKRWNFFPRRLTGQQKFPDLSVKMFGETFPYPIGVGPVGVQKIFHPEGESATARAAAELDIPYTFSSAGATSIEDVAKASGTGKRWFQLYWPSNKYNDITQSLLERAQKSGYEVLVVNVDTYIVGWRPHDMDEGYSPFLRPDHIGVEMGFSDPVFQKLFKEQTGQDIEENLGLAAATWSRIFTAGFPHPWEDLQFLRKHWKGPMVVKGIQCADDALRCVEAGMEGIVVSNHGGREVDGNVASLDMLPEIADAVSGKLVIMYDSGVRNGTDALKALALGADFVLLGRPWVYGLAIGGQAGVRHVLKAFLGEMQMSLHLMGIGSVSKKELNRSILRYKA